MLKKYTFHGKQVPFTGTTKYKKVMNERNEGTKVAQSLVSRRNSTRNLTQPN